MTVDMNNMRPFHAYADKGRFVCICYANGDAPQVYPVLRQLYMAGFNLWYDEGREPCDTLTDQYNKRIDSCELVVMFLSPAAADPESDAYARLSRARAMRKYIIYVHLDGIALPEGMKAKWRENTVISGSAAEVYTGLYNTLPDKCRACPSREPDDFSVDDRGDVARIAGIAAEGKEEEASDLLETSHERERTAALEGIEYTFSGDCGITLARYTGSATELIVPEMRGNYPVTRLGDKAFLGCATLHRVALPPTVTFIGHAAFRNCSALAEVLIPASVTAIGVGAFYNCVRLKSAVLPDSVAAIGDFAFRGCTGLSRLTIPNSVAAIGDDAFRDCMQLIVECLEGSYVHWYCTRNNIPFRLIPQAEMTSRMSPLRATRSGEQRPAQESTSAAPAAPQEDTAPPLDLAETTAAAVAAIQLPEDKAEDEDEEPIITIVEEYEDEAEPVAEPERTEAQPNTDAYMPAQLDRSPVLQPVGERYACVFFASEDYERVKTSVTRLEAAGFNLWRGENPTRSVRAYRAMEAAIARCRMILVFISAQALRSERVMQAEVACALKSRAKDITVVQLDDTPAPRELVSAVDGDRFLVASTMSALLLDNTLIKLLAEAGCKRSSTPAPPPAQRTAQRAAQEEERLRKGRFAHPDFDYTVATDGATISLYKGKEERVEIPAKMFGYGVAELGSRAFHSNANLREVIIPQSVTALGVEVFKGCSNLTRVHLPASVVKLGYGCFRDCRRLVDISIPSSVTEIGWHAFAGCTSLKHVAIPQHVSKIDSWAFDGCTSLQTVSIPDRVERIDVNAFFNCPKRMVIVASKDSYAHQFAVKNGYRWKRSK